VIIMTSNLGSEHLLHGLNSEGEIKEHTRDMVMAELRAHTRPEFLNRVDDIVLFKPLSVAQIERIVDNLLASLRARLSDRKIGIEMTEPARFALAREGYDPVYGARPLRRLIQRKVETLLARALIAGTIIDGQTVEIGYDGAEYTVESKPAAA